MDTAAHRHLVCPSCLAINRVPATRPADHANCGACHKPLFGAPPPSVTAAALDKHLGKGDLPVLLDLWAPWCGPCQQMGPQFARAASLLEPAVRLLKLNVDEASELSARLRVQSIPTLVLFRHGNPVARQSGLMSAEQIAAWTRPHLT